MTLVFTGQHAEMDEAVVDVKVYDWTPAGKIYIATQQCDKNDIPASEPDEVATDLAALHAAYIAALG